MHYLNKILPLMGLAKSHFPSDRLANAYIIACRHILPSTYILFHKFFSLGLKRENLAVIGKCYSTSPLVYAEMKSDGIDVCPTSKMFDGHRPYNDQLQENIRNFITRQIKKCS